MVGRSIRTAAEASATPSEIGTRHRLERIAQPCRPAAGRPPSPRARVALGADHHPARLAVPDVEDMKPGSRAVGDGGEVEHCLAIEKHRVADTRLVEGHPLRVAPVGPYSPDVHDVAEAHPDEIDEGIVRRPGRKMAVRANGSHINLPSGRLARSGDEERVAWRRGVVDQACSVTRPVQLRGASKKYPQRTAHGGHRRDVDRSLGVGGSGRAAPQSRDPSGENRTLRISSFRNSRTSSWVRL